MARLGLLVLAAVMAVQTAAAPVSQASYDSVIEAATYLAKYGYSSDNNISDRSQQLEDFAVKIAEFQRFAGLNVTGELDPPTMQKMRMPRCGVKDKLGPSYRARRRKRYALQGSRWRVKSLKYKIMSWPTRLMNNKEGVRQAIKEAFKVWSDVSGLTFQEVSGRDKANIEIMWASGDHNDGDKFDGPGGTLAHAFFPIYGGDAHFDDDEAWTVTATSRGRGIDLFMTAAHEFGHSLGLSHSDDGSALMAPFYKPPSKDRNVVKDDDRRAIQKLYGLPPTTQTPVKPKTDTREEDKESSDSILCSDPSVDAMLTYEVGGTQRTYAFKGSNYWRLTATGIERKYPRKIADAWGGVPDNLDAVLPIPDKNLIYFFKGDKYWKMENLRMSEGYPRLIRIGFPGIPDNIDAAFQYIANGKVYFFKGSEYWGMDTEAGSAREAISSVYPQPISNWRGVPNNIDSVVTYSNDKTYFFKGSRYYRFDDVNFKVDDATPPYPRSTASYWFGCQNQPASLVTEPSNRGDIAAEDEYGDAGSVSIIFDA